MLFALLLTNLAILCLPKCPHVLRFPLVCDSKCDYPAACNAMETLLVHRAHVESGLLEKLCHHLRERGVSWARETDFLGFQHLVNCTLPITCPLTVSFIISGYMHCF